MRKNFGAKPWTYPQPVFIVATYDAQGNADAMNAAWGGIDYDDQINMCLSAGHKTVKNLLETKAFTVSMGTEEQLTACDYVGIVSGNKVEDKLEKAGWHAVKSESDSYTHIRAHEPSGNHDCSLLLEYNKDRRQRTHKLVTP